ncbi:cyclase family protein [Thalassotalea mangrovi]|uniref:Cyclase family protein n=1 Tax=Thalassotalea mangrovi TaxID=2572245 RepID=A0A4U1B8R7_9GAMM|nr:cyclase family protein [Thalassotalea mangrovi]TKB46356.1 cyclase family protein [Thalassotalea mangrovi]
MKLIDLSHTIFDGLITYKGLPAPHVCDFLSREQSKKHYNPDTSFLISEITLCSNTGTYLDTPFHRYQNGQDTSAVPLSALANLPGIKITVAEGIRAIDAEYFQHLDDLTGKAVLVETNWSRHFNSEQYYQEHPYLTQDAAEYLQQQRVALVGIDSLNIDDTQDSNRPVHSILLANNILIVEHLTNLKQIPEDNFRFTATPVKIKGVGTFPVRAFATIDAT